MALAGDETTQGPSPRVETMRAVRYYRYGLPEDVVSIEQISVPRPNDDQVLLRVAASSVNALDWHLMTGLPMIARLSVGLRRPGRNTPGADVAGTVVAVGGNVRDLSIGDEVFGEIPGGGFAEYAAVPARALVKAPTNIPLEESATLGVAALTALQGLRDWGGLRPGDRVVINGASGGVGTFAVQIAKALGASNVTAVCSTPNVEAVAALGADRVVDYRQEDLSRSGDKFDLLFDNAGSWSLGACKRLLEKDGRMAIVTGKKGRWIAPMPRVVAAMLRSMAWSQKVGNGVAKSQREDLETIRDMVEDGEVRPAIDRRYPLSEAVELLRYQGEGHSRAKSLLIP